MEADHEAMKQLDQAAESYVVVLTKIDTLSAAEREEAVQQCRTALRGHVAAYPDILSTSSETGQGLDMLKAHIAALARP